MCVDGELRKNHRQKLGLVRNLVTLRKASKNLMKVLTKSVQMTTIPKAAR